MSEAIKTRYRFIHFTQDTQEPRKWHCRNNKQPDYTMGVVGFYYQWKQWIFTQSGPDYVFSADCLRDIAHFMEQLPKCPL